MIFLLNKKLQSLCPLRFSPFSRKLKSGTNKGRLRRFVLKKLKYKKIVTKLKINSLITKGGSTIKNIEKIYEEYFVTVNKYLFCLTHNIDISEELTQETFYKAIKNIDKFKGKCKMSVWLCQIAKNLWYDELRKKKIEKIDEEQLFSIKAIENTEEIVIKNNEKIDLYKKIQKLDEKAREVVYLKLTGELSFKEIANILNKTENWARTTFYRSKQKLKEGD